MADPALASGPAAPTARDCRDKHGAGRLILLDGMRGLAAIAVMFHHERQLFNEDGWFSRSYLAVDFFFLLSGFVLTLAFEQKFGAGLKTSAFMKKRIVRLWPMLALGIVIGAIKIALMCGPGQSYGALAFLMALSLMMIPFAAIPGPIFILNGPQWSLMFEIVANLAHTSILHKLQDHLLLIITSLAGLLLGYLSLEYNKVGVGDLSSNWWMGFVRVGFSYTAGVWLGRKWRNDHPRRLMPWWVTFGALPAVLVLIKWAPVSVGLGDALAVLLIFPAILWAASSSSVPAALNAYMAKLGNLSYPLYAIHCPILGLGAWLDHQLLPEYAGVARILTTVLVLVLALALGERSSMYSAIREARAGRECLKIIARLAKRAPDSRGLVA